ncbi:MAG: hypothetical protein ACFFFY_12230 [Promethearchaeota archaeon]
MPKKKIFFIITIFSILFLTIAGVNVRAHPPDDMSLEFNSGTSTLKVTIIHGVSDNTTHYISSVEIRVNGTIDQTQFYSSQPALDVFIYEYTVVTSNVSIIQVTATCIVGGSLTRTLGSTTGPSGGAIPGYLGFYLILTISVVTLIPIIRKKLKRVKI